MQEANIQMTSAVFQMRHGDTLDSEDSEIQGEHIL